MNLTCGHSVWKYSKNVDSENLAVILIEKETMSFGKDDVKPLSISYPVLFEIEISVGQHVLL